MEILATYDVSTETPAGRRRLRRVALTCVAFGQRVQKSVFECSVNQMQYEEFRQKLLDLIDEKEDSLRLYRLREPRGEHVEHYGVRPSVDYDEPMVL